VDIGSGHLMRCLTLADQLRVEGVEVAFACRELPGAMFDLLLAQGYPCATFLLNEDSNNSQHSDAQETIKAAERLFPNSIDWLVVDHYQLETTWEQEVRPHARKLMVIDDLANRPHDCDLLLDQNYYHVMGQRYQELLPKQCVQLLGPAYVLLRQDFLETRRQLRVRDGTIRRILVSFGGSDPTNQTQKVIKALKQLNNHHIGVDIVVGQANPNRSKIEAFCNELTNVTFHCQVSNMAQLIHNADLGVGAGGVSMWERCYLGLPTITVVIAANQFRTTEDVAEIGAIEYLGWADVLSPDDFAYSISEIIANPQHAKRISDAALGIMQTSRTSTVDVMRNLT
jgi:UDP-2,4-diacetamido-2,4,6-trideoxy-beta-L-altropyranose hydrolase